MAGREAIGCMVSVNRPNIVLLLADQLRRDALGCYGNTVCRTPNIDRLAAESMRFDQAYTTSPVCSPSRASLLTGLYPHNHGVMLNTHIKPAWCLGLTADVPTFSRILKDQGYALDYVGKWHVNAYHGPQVFGFDRHIISEHRNSTRSGTEIYVDFPGHPFCVAATSVMPKEQERTSCLFEKGIELLRQRAKESEPFFLRIDTPAPHFPNIIPEPYASMYDPDQIPPWPNFEESFDGKPAAQLRKHEEWHLQNKDWHWWSRVVAHYYGDITLLDECVGRMLDAIKECGLSHNTIVILSTDHGDSMGSHRHFEKAGTMYDEIFRVPLLVRTPAAEGGASDCFVRLMDLMPTLCELGGAAVPPALDARSLKPLLGHESPKHWPDSVYAEHHGEVWGFQSQRMVRTTGWKYVFNPHDLDELYDLASDPFEKLNLASQADHAAVLAEMKARLLGWNDATGDMFQWKWVRWNFPDPVRPEDVNQENLPLTAGA